MHSDNATRYIPSCADRRGMAGGVDVREEAKMMPTFDVVVLLAERDKLREALENIRDLARTDLAPDALAMDSDEWNCHRIKKIARLANEALESEK